MADLCAQHTAETTKARRMRWVRAGCLAALTVLYAVGITANAAIHFDVFSASVTTGGVGVTIFVYIAVRVRNRDDREALVVAINACTVCTTEEEPSA